MFRAVSEIRPTWVVGENVAGITTMVEGGILTEVGREATLFGEDDNLHRYELRQSFTIERICKDFEAIGYEVQPILIPAAACGAPHRRDRVFFLAYNAQDPDGLRREDGTSDIGGKDQQHRDARSRDSERLRPEARTDSANPGNAGPQGQREGAAEVHSPGSAAHSDGTRRGQMDQHLQPELTDVSEPFGLGRERTTADTDREGLQESQQSRRAENSAEERGGVHNRAVGPREHGPASNTFCERLSAALQSRVYGLEKRDGARRPAELFTYDAWIEGTWWNQFPTVSPVHSGNDGIPIRMDGITIPFGKWRNEAIKAYGNAIVPQVMYRIFQAIEKISK